MSDLADRLKRLISAGGPISVAEYMAACLFDPEGGYYTTREPFGVQGDFTTAPEISQMYGELLAVWALAAWRAMDRPVPFVFGEIGPGRGTLMADMLRTLNRLDPPFVILGRIAMIEASPRLAEMQRARLAAGKGKPTWFDKMESLPALPLILLGNEIFDALPFRQFVKTSQGWRERMVTLDDNGEFCFAAGMAGIDPDLLPASAETAPEGAIFEIAPAREAMMGTIAAHIAKRGGAALFADYGNVERSLGDTFQAVRAHSYCGVFEHPGEADLTSHVDFAALATVARAHELDVHTATQGDFLVGMGLLERAGALGANADQSARDRLQADVDRLAGPDGMGTLFKVMVVTSPGMALPPFAGAD